MAMLGKVVIPESLSFDSSKEELFAKKVQDIKFKGQHGKLTPGVVYIGHIPHGFFEQQMKKFFSQFGKVNRLRISRSKKTGKIKGYAFVEFECDEVAKIVADTMNNYLMFHRLLKCQYLPLSKVHPETFKGSERKFKKPKAHLLAIQRHNVEKTNQHTREQERRRSKKLTKKLKKLKELGVDYMIEPVQKKLKRSIGSCTDSDNEYHVLDDENLDDSEIAFKTPPQTIKSSKLQTPGISYVKTPKGTVKLTAKSRKVASVKSTTPKAVAKQSMVKIDGETPKCESLSTLGNASSKKVVPGKSATANTAVQRPVINLENETPKCKNLCTPGNKSPKKSVGKKLNSGNGASLAKAPESKTPTRFQPKRAASLSQQKNTAKKSLKRPSPDSTRSTRAKK